MINAQLTTETPSNILANDARYVSIIKFFNTPAYSLLNPSNAEAILSSKAQGNRNLCKPSKPCHVGIHWIALAEYSQMSTHLPGFQSIFRFLHHFVLAKLVTSSIRVIKFIHLYLLHRNKPNCCISLVQASLTHSCLKILSSDLSYLRQYL